MISSKYWKQLIVFVAVGVALSCWFLWPLLSHLTTQLTSHDDGLLIGWTVHWVSSALIRGSDVYQAPFLHPYPATLAFSQLFLSTGLLNIPFYLAGVPLVASQNLHFVLGSIAMFVAMAILMWEVRQSWPAAILAGTLFAFSPLHLEFVVHLHIYLLAGLPVLAWALVRMAHVSASLHQRYGWVMSGALVYQALNDPHGAFYALAIAGVIFLTLPQVRATVRHSWKQLLPPVLFTGIVIALCYLPYLDVARTYQYTRSIRDAAHFSYSLDRWWQPDSIAVVVLIILLWTARRRNIDLTDLTTWALMAVLGLILMLGPVLKYHDHTVKLGSIPIPLPYALAYYVIPGFQAMRAATRWLVVANFGVAMLAGALLAQSRLSRRMQWGVVGGVTVLCWLASLSVVKTHPVPTQIPVIYTTVASRPESVLAEFPLMHWDMPPYSSLEAERLLFQTKHGKRLYNGITGFTPPARLAEIIWLWRAFPQQAAIDRLHAQGVELLLVHFDQYQRMSLDHYQYDTIVPPSADQLRVMIANQPALHLITCQKNACLYSL